MAQAIAQQTRQRRRRRSIKVKIQRPRPLATPPSRSDCIDGHLNYAHIVKRAFANWAIFEKLCKKKRRKKAYWSCGSLRATPPFPPSVLSPHGVGKKLRNFLLMLRHKQRRRRKAAQLVSNLSWAVDDVATVAAKRRQTKGKRQCAVELATYLRTARRANPTPLTALAPLSHPSTHNSTHTGASLRHMRGANVKYIKKRKHDDGMWNSPRRAATGNLPPALPPPPSPPPHCPLLASLPRVWLPRAVTRKTTQFSACMPPVEAACDPLRLCAGYQARGQRAARWRGRGGPQFDGAKSCAREQQEKSHKIPLDRRS